MTGAVKSGQRVHQRCLACPIWTDERDNFPRSDFQGNVPEGAHIPIIGGDIADLEKRAYLPLQGLAG